MFRQVMQSVMLLVLLVQVAPAAVILMYHHVDATTPAATSVTPEQFAEHLDRLQQEGFTVLRLDALIEAVKQGADARDKLVAITFDDAYKSIYEVGLPLLEAKDWQGTVFVNAGGVDRGGRAMTTEMITDMHRRGHLVLNHSVSHPHMVRRQSGESEAQWRDRIRSEIEQAQQAIEGWTGAEALPWLAYPYGEQDAALRQLLIDMGYLGFGQQSGALDAAVDWQNIPRIPVNRHQASWSSLRDKVLALPFPVIETIPADGVTVSARPSLTLMLEGDWRRRGVQCFIGSQVVSPAMTLERGITRLVIDAPSAIPVGRSRYNCTASAGEGRFHWYSWVWMRRTAEGWYAE
ncbi:MAG: hypothetical protein CVV10_00545 [Gammaproteobacteria bacterium HGW-Gammaproteobacteria-14]|nr:MAG: hypothetical protein CVV10_00545 [Gammaproteobacteria bacterium HGW-Gammaproteobacteria-14]